MKKLFLFLLLSALSAGAAFAARDLGDITVNADNKTIPVRVTASTAELQNLALQAFGAHGRYRLVSSGQNFDIKFTQVAPTQVRVDIAKTRGTSSESIASETVTGATPRNALFKAADVAVVKTNGLALRGFFTSRLTFISQASGKKEVCVGDLFFGEMKQLTQDRAIAMTPRWSPDGTRIAYTSYFKGAPDIYAIELGSYQRTTLASFKGTNSGAHYSPSGRQLAMVLSGTGTTEIWVGDAQGRNPVRRTSSDSVKASPCWSPDGSRLIFAMEPGPQLYVMPAAGGAPSRVSSGVSYCAEPDWSRADPNKVVFTMKDGRRYQIAVLDLAKRESHKVSDAPFDGIEPSWLPDGRHVVYTARDASTSVLCILDTETGKSTKVSPANVNPALQASVLAQ